ncbi:uncharacterized protein SPSK_10120 [Sporothrix schenckii 1099-18]|uniref:Uncharacterized protein n=1 Tax=Sporothrix schenckii 1099-18 TaxID=1397361 RepID=A0A0F2M9D6_SPOSC|nr:uncharacterized protein SPSK_10120 [Sporothrix schenckii 1099-18]KJR85694.1 hypothetical protein SPSK_10120 [Sporothrix schenckii 1099-18]
MTDDWLSQIDKCGNQARLYGGEAGCTENDVQKEEAARKKDEQKEAEKQSSRLAGDDDVGPGRRKAKAAACFVWLRTRNGRSIFLFLDLSFPKLASSSW